MTDYDVLSSVCEQIQVAQCHAEHRGYKREDVHTVLTKPMLSAIQRVLHPLDSQKYDASDDAPIIFHGSHVHIYGNNVTPPDFLLSLSFNRQTMTLTEAFYLVAKQDPRSKVT